jgi:hypothetical protein
VVSARFYPLIAQYLIKEDVQIASLNTITTPSSTEITTVAHIHLKIFSASLLELGANRRHPPANAFADITFQPIMPLGTQY